VFTKIKIKGLLRILMVFSVAVSSLLFATPSQAAPTDKWVTAVGPREFYVKDTSNLSVGSSVSLKTPGIPDRLFNPFPGGVTITGISVSPTIFSLCGTQYTCPNSGGFATGDTVYEVTVNVNIFTFYTLAEFTFDGGPSTSPGNTPMFSSGSSYDGRYTVQVSNYDPAFTYSVTSTVGQATISSSGLVTATGLSKDQSVTVTVTTTRTGYESASASISGRAQVAPMLPTNKPTVTLSDTLITCTIGSYSATPTSSAFSLFVDGKHISTIFSALGDYLPDWIIPWATSSTITRTATLTSATWTIADDYKGKSITCATLAYSKNAIGFTATQALIAR
jgi:hypothetical protein